MAKILGQDVERKHARLVAVVDISPEPLERRRRHVLSGVVAQMNRKLLKVGCRAERLSIFLFNEQLQLLYFRCIHCHKLKCCFVCK